MNAGVLKLKQNCFCKNVPHNYGVTYFTKKSGSSHSKRVVVE